MIQKFFFSFFLPKISVFYNIYSMECKKLIIFGKVCEKPAVSINDNRELECRIKIDCYNVLSNNKDFSLSQVVAICEYSIKELIWSKISIGQNIIAVGIYNSTELLNSKILLLQ